MRPCPTCGSTGVPCPECDTESDQDARIASWIDGPLTDSVPSKVGPESVCTACGYSGDMNGDDRSTSCPACGVVLPTRRSDVTLRVTRLVDCPECGRQIGVTAEDEGKAVVCPGCSYFLGTPVEKASGSGSTGGRPRPR
jgi:predicted RNA-binding Zn-ribbon protein involved in translation (DUF1610 family)